MDRKYIGTALALKYLNCMSMKSLDQRILVQKKFYLAQAFGAKFGYHYNWYLRGPYSKDLTSAVFSILAQNPEELEGYSLSEEAEDLLYRFNQLEKKKPKDLSVSDWYELLASILFLRDDYGLNGLKEKTSVGKKLLEFKPWYLQKDINIAWKELTVI